MTQVGNRGRLKGRKLIWRIAFFTLLVTSFGGCIFATNNPPNPHYTLCYGGLPLGYVDEVLSNTGYLVGYSDMRENPLWVSYHVFAVPNPVSHPRPSRFKTDTRTTALVSYDDYTNSGYDRGHMAPNATIDYCYGQDAQGETFYMSNVCPQTPTLNRGIWAKLEAAVRNWANAFEEVWVITGPIFDNDVETLASGVEIPDAFYKIIVDEDNGFPRVLSFVILQDVTSGTQLVSYLTSVDKIEQITGFDFLSDIPDTIEYMVESEVPTALWTSTNTQTTSVSGATGSCIFELAHVDAVRECITLRNMSSKTESLAGWTISDGEGRYTFPDDVLVNAGETYTVCMPMYNPKKYTRGLYLNNKHDEVYLYDPSGLLCDEVTW